jgi:hypothetical protein
MYQCGMSCWKATSEKCRNIKRALREADKQRHRHAGTKMLGRTAPQRRRNQEKLWPHFTRQLRLDLRPGDMRWRQDLRPLSCVSNYLVQLLILRWGSLRGKHQHLSIGAGIATGWPWLCLLPGFDCPSTLAMHVNSTPAIHLRRTP